MKQYKAYYGLYGSTLKEAGEYGTFQEAIDAILETYKLIGSSESSNYHIETPGGKIIKLIADEKGIKLDT